MKHEIQALIFKLLANPEGFTLVELKELEGKLNLFNKAKSMGLDTDLIDDQAIIDLAEVQKN